MIMMFIIIIIIIIIIMITIINMFGGRALPEAGQAAPAGLLGREFLLARRQPVQSLLSLLVA